ncbi:TPA: hypothetical protein ACXPNG_005282 [Salmonella enterica]
MSFKLLQHRPQVGAFLEQQLLVQLENVLQVAAEYAPHELVTYGLPGHSHRKRKLTAVCSHQTRIGNLDAHLI